MRQQAEQRMLGQFDKVSHKLPQGVVEQKKIELVHGNAAASSESLSTT